MWPGVLLIKKVIGIRIPRMKVLPNLKAEIRIEFSGKILIPFLFCYHFGLYGFRTFNPEWQNLDGKVFFWLSELLMYASIPCALVLFFSNSRANSEFKLVFSLRDIALLFSLIVTRLFLYKDYLVSSLVGDELSYAKYSIAPVESIVFPLSQAFSLNLHVDLSFRFGILFTLVLIYYLVRKVSLSKATVFLKVMTLTSVTFILRGFSRLVFENDIENTEPFLIGYQLGIIIFGFNEFGFRLSSLIMQSLFFMLLAKLLVKSQVVSQKFCHLSVLLFSLIPPVTSAAFTVYHGNVAFYVNLIGLMLLIFHGTFSTILEPRLLVLFGTLSILISLSTIPIIVSIFVLYARRNIFVFLKKIIRHGADIVCLLIPFCVGHFFRLVKLKHVEFTLNEIGQGNPQSFFEKIYINMFSVFKSFSLVFVVLGFIGILIALHLAKQNINGIIVYILTSQIAFSLFPVAAGLGVSAYSIQWLGPFVFVSILFILLLVHTVSKILYKLGLLVLTSSLICLLVVDIDRFRSQLSDYELATILKPQYASIRDWAPKNFIWGMNANPHSIAWTKEDECLLIGVPNSPGISRVIAGSSFDDYANDLKLRQAEGRDVLEYFEYLDPKLSQEEPGNLKANCVFTSYHPYRILIEHKLMELGFFKAQSQMHVNGITVAKWIRG